MWRISHQKHLAGKFLFALMITSRDIVKIWTVKFSKPPVIHQVRQGFPPPKIHTKQYVASYIIQINTSSVGL